MTYETILTAVLETAATLPADEAAAFDQFVKRRETDKAPTLAPCVGLAKLARQLEEAIRQEQSRTKSRGGATQYKAISRHASTDEYRKAYHGTIPTEKGRVLCDSYRAVRITNPDITTPENAPEGHHINFEEIIKPAAGAVETALPTIQELKAAIKIYKATVKAAHPHKGVKSRSVKPAVVELQGRDGGKVYANAQYILDMMEALPGATAQAGGAVEPIYFSSADGDGIVMPIRSGFECYIAWSAAPAQSKPQADGEGMAV